MFKNSNTLVCNALLFKGADTQLAEVASQYKLRE